MDIPVWKWIKGHKWLLLLLSLFALLIISPVAEVFDQQDNIISPLVAVVFLVVAFGLAERRVVIWLLAILTMAWLIISILTEGSGLFVGKSILAPVLFMVILAAVLVLLARWLIQVAYIDQEVLCAAVCGYLLLGILWTGLYSVVEVIRPGALVTVDHAPIDLGERLYFSFTTLTTIGFGDILPRNPVVRMLTVTEAIVGIFYNTIVIARFVGLYGLKPPGFREFPDRL
jgi:hypothetical protein